MSEHDPKCYPTEHALEKLLEAEFETYCAKAGPDATAEGFEQHAVPLMMADPEMLRAATRLVAGDPEMLRAAITKMLDEEPEARLVAKSDEDLMKFLQSRPRRTD
jgi:hypothetical protein